MRLSVSALALSLVSVPAQACLPPPLGTTEEERLGEAVGRTTDIVYGVVERGARGDGSARFRVIHVYRGDLAAGDIIVAPASLGFDPPLCMGFTIHAPEPAATRGQYGVVAFHDGAPALHFINPVTLERMFEFGLIERATPVE